MKEQELIELLKSYSVCKRFLHAQKYAKEYFDHDNEHEIVLKDEYEAKIHIIESLIQSVKQPSDAYTILHLHYIKNLPIEKVSECMGISTRTAFRLRDKAHKSLYYTLVRKEYLTDERAD